MDNTLLSLLLIALTVIVAFTLFLTLRLTMIVVANEQQRAPLALPADSPLPAFTGRTLSGERLSALALTGQPAVLVFLAPQCKDCQARVGEIVSMYPAMQRAGVALWLIGTTPRQRLIAFLADTPLLERVLWVSRAAARRLNPKTAAPFYIFIDHQRMVQASHLIGDENWLSFCQQMREVDPNMRLPS